MRARRLWAVPRWTARAAFVAIAAWALLVAVGEALRALEILLATTLPPIEVGPNSWRPAAPLANAPLRAQIFAATAGLALPVAVVAVGMATWRHRAARRRFLVAFVLLDLVLCALVYDQLARPYDSTLSMLVTAQLRATLGFAILVALAWTRPAARALGAAALLWHLFPLVPTYLFQAPGPRTLPLWTYETLAVLSPLARAFAFLLLAGALMLSAGILARRRHAPVAQASAGPLQ